MAADLTTTPIGPLRGQIAWVSRRLPNSGAVPAATLVTYELWATPLDGSPSRLAVRYQSVFSAVPRDTNVLRRQFSPDGRRIVLSVAVGIGQQLRVINLETGAIALPLPSNSFPGATQIDVNPVWSPDGAHIAFVRLSAPRLYGWLPGSQSIGFDPAPSGQGSYAALDLNGVVTPPAAFAVTSDDPASWGSAAQSLLIGARQAGLAADRSQVLQGQWPEQRLLNAIADVTVNPNDNNVTGVRDPRWDPTGALTLIYLESGVERGLVLVDLNTLNSRTTKLVSGRVAFADWLSNGDAIVTLEEHPSTAPLSVYVYERSGRLRSGGLFLIFNDTTVVLTDLAARLLAAITRRPHR